MKVSIYVLKFIWGFVFVLAKHLNKIWFVVYSTTYWPKISGVALWSGPLTISSSISGPKTTSSLPTKTTTESKALVRQLLRRPPTRSPRQLGSDGRISRQDRVGFIKVSTDCGNKSNLFLKMQDASGKSVPVLYFVFPRRRKEGDEAFCILSRLHGRRICRADISQCYTCRKQPHQGDCVPGPRPGPTHSKVFGSQGRRLHTACSWCLWL